MTQNSPSVCLCVSLLHPQPPPFPSPAQSALCSQIDGGICLFMNTEVTCNQPERAQAALCFGPVSAT